MLTEEWASGFVKMSLRRLLQATSAGEWVVSWWQLMWFRSCFCAPRALSNQQWKVALRSNCGEIKVGVPAQHTLRSSWPNSSFVKHRFHVRGIMESDIATMRGLLLL